MKTAFALVAATLVACGGINDNGADKVAGAGVLLRVNSIVNATSTVNTTCKSGLLTFVQADEAAAALENKPAPNNDSGVDITVQSYEVDYTPLDGGPEISRLDPILTTLVVPAKGKAEMQVIAFSEETKDSFVNATTGTTSYATVRLYQLHYTFKGVTEFNDAVEAQGDVTLRLGNTFVTTCK